MGVNRPAFAPRDDPQPEIRLQIDELVLEGFDARHSARIAAALEAELSRLLNEEGAAQAIRHAAQAWNASDAESGMVAGPIQLSPRHSPEAIGRQAAQAIYAGWRR
jgi:hypothetical protein